MSFFEGVGFFLLFSLMGGIVGILLLIRGRSRKDEIPLVPIIAAAYIFYLPLSMPIYYFLGWSLRKKVLHIGAFIRYILDWCSFDSSSNAF